MPADEEQIRTLIERWAEAVRSGDMSGVLADHSEDIVMFDVPPPYDGVRGIDAYREAWPQFFEWQEQGASFQIESLDVTAGDDVAFAHALLRCGTPQELADRPENRLRLTLGLRKESGRWVVAHEHHSFPYTGTDTDMGTEAGGGDVASEREVRLLHQQWYDRTAAKDLDGLMAAIGEDIVSYEHEEPLQYVGLDAVRAVCKRGLDAASGAVGWDVPDLTILAREDLAVAWGLNHVRAEQGTGETIEAWSRGTRVFRRQEGAWVVVHQHLSIPYDPATGEARTDLHP
ncbi:YybH family protein [Actinomadura alba]|uniref:SgcJ/EcaC family oxidoreductase n=1 Tax=Actinomadura alba TaxID=406431 RepID=A0ABR7LR95_9ACTN|nr:SgcJ/EcaC family oxidoreductase [Actinomadura alba]MBC6466933.1 SgcJ/EcaC family oxidoreductase [Actinomadura alba]